MKIHDNIPQYEYRHRPDLVQDKLFTCPNCQAMKSAGFNYSTVDTPPIALQIDDNRRSITRTWLAHRCYCGKCDYMWDVVTVNKTETA